MTTEYEKEDFATEHIGIVTAVVRRYAGKRIDESELHSIGLVGYAKALKKYNEIDVKVKFTTYAYGFILNEIQTVMREEFKKRSIRDTASLDYPMASGDSDGSLLGDVIGGKDNNYSLSDMQECISRLRLTKLEKKVLDLTVKGYKQNEIGEMTGYTKGYVNQVVKVIKDKLKIEMER